jgi:hypothetical protein
MVCWRWNGIKLLFIIIIQISSLIHIRRITIKQLQLIQRSTNLLKSRLDLSSSAVALSRLYYFNIYLNCSHLMMRSICLIKDFFFLQEWIVKLEGFLLHNPNINTHLLKIFNLDCKFQFWPYLLYHHKEVKSLPISDFTNCYQYWWRICCCCHGHPRKYLWCPFQFMHCILYINTISVWSSMTN